jgi:hypothetical protein
VQEVVDGHAIASRPLLLAPDGWAVHWIVQWPRLPRSASVAKARTPFAKLPTAVQAVVVRQTTAKSWVARAPRRLGVGSITQLEPLQRSASVTDAPDRRAKDPTPSQNRSELH